MYSAGCFWHFPKIHLESQQGSWIINEVKIKTVQTEVMNASSGKALLANASDITYIFLMCLYPKSCQSFENGFKSLLKFYFR